MPPIYPVNAPFPRIATHTKTTSENCTRITSVPTASVCFLETQRFFEEHFGRRDPVHFGPLSQALMTLQKMVAPDGIADLPCLNLEMIEQALIKMAHLEGLFEFVDLDPTLRREALALFLFSLATERDVSVSWLVRKDPPAMDLNDLDIDPDNKADLKDHIDALFKRALKGERQVWEELAERSKHHASIVDRLATLVRNGHDGLALVTLCMAGTKSPYAAEIVCNFLETPLLVENHQQTSMRDCIQMMDFSVLGERAQYDAGIANILLRLHRAGSQDAADQLHRAAKSSPYAAWLVHIMESVDN